MKKKVLITLTLGIIFGVGVFLAMQDRIAKPLLTDAVVRMAMSHWLDRLATGDTTPQTAAFAARQAKYHEDLSKNFAGNDERLYLAEYASFSRGEAGQDAPPDTFKALTHYRSLLFDSLRQELGDPARLWSLYQEKKSLVMSAIARRPELRSQIVAFLGDAGDTFLDVSRGKPNGDRYTVLFAERRNTEGGQRLVETYAKICYDLRKSL